MRSDFTRFVASHIAGSSFDGLCFGDPVRQVVQKHITTSYFRPGQVFAVLWWRRYSQDRQHRTLAVAEALPAERTGCILPGVDRAVAVHALVPQHGPAGQDGAVDQLLDLIEDFKSNGTNPTKFPPEFWRQTVRDLLLGPMLELKGMEDVLCLG